MRTFRLLIPALIGVMAVVACSDTPDTVDEALTSLPAEEDVAELAAEVQSEISAVATEIENSEAADDLRSAWSEVQTVMTEAVNSITANEAVDTEAIRAELDDFQAEVEAAGDTVGDELVDAWNELRSSFEQLMS